MRAISPRGLDLSTSISDHACWDELSRLEIPSQLNEQKAATHQTLPRKKVVD